jgi:hypothetical protein
LDVRARDLLRTRAPDEAERERELVGEQLEHTRDT